MFETTDNVQLGTNIFKNGTYTIALESPEGRFCAEQKIYLKDRLLNHWIDLTSHPYIFEATKGITEGRFEIMYEVPAVLATDSVVKDELLGCREGGDFVVEAKNKKISSLEVYDASGRFSYTSQKNDTRAVVTGDRLSSGMYILKINHNGGDYRKENPEVIPGFITIIPGHQAWDFFVLYFQVKSEPLNFCG